jgi:hypothetical protein
MQGNIEKKNFVSDDSLLNADDAPYAISPNNWVNAENIRVETTDTGATNVGQSIGGTLLLSQPQPSINFITIGQATDEENFWLVEFKYNTTGRQDKIVAYNSQTNTNYDVLLSSQVTGGLNFDKNALIHSARIANGCIYFANGTTNQPRKVNLEAAIKANNPSFVTDEVAYNFPINFSEITIIKPSAAFAPNITKSTDTSFNNNFIANNSLEFAFQYVWYDNETTVCGAYSEASRLNLPTETYNRIGVTMDTFEQIPDTVRIVNLVVRIGDGTAGGGNVANVVKTWDKNVASEAAEIVAQNNGSVLLNYFYYGNSTGETISPDDVLRQSDNVSIYSQALEVSNSRLFLANNTEGYDTPETTSFLLSLGTRISLADTSQSVNIIEFKHRYVNTPNATSQYAYSAWIVNIPFISPAGFYLINGTDASVTYPAAPDYPTLPPKPATVALSGLTYLGPSNQAVSATRPSGFNLTNQLSVVTQPDLIFITGVTPTFYNVMAQKSPYAGGVVFMDFAMRRCGVSNNNPNAGGYTIGYTTPLISFSAQAPNEFTIYNSQGAYISVGDKIEITTTAAAGTYTVTAVDLTGFPSIQYDITVLETVVSVATTMTVINILNVNSVQVTTPPRGFNYSVAVSNLDWSLSNANAINEIPDWAYYYLPVLTLNLRTRFFIQSFSNALKYATKDTNGVYQFNSDLYITSAVGIGLNTAALVQSGLGYVFTEGDVCILVRGNDETFEIPVIGQDGNYIILKAQDIGSLAGVQFVFEIYTPYITNANEFYYDRGQVYTITNPGQPNRGYSITTGSFNADSYALTRNYGAFTYFAGAMSPNDLFYKRWDNDGSKVNIVTKLGQVVKTQYIRWSDTFIPNTGINGLSTFRSGNQKPVPEDCGSITKLILTSKVQAEGTVMLSICANETNSMYLQETQITDATGATQFFGASDEVIGTINTLKGSFGSINPESVAEYRGNVFFFSALTGKYIQYSANGLFPISNYKMTRFWNLFSLQYMSMSAAEIEALGSRPFIFSTVDPNHNELLISIPKLSNTPPKGYLPDYPNAIYPFDIYDLQGKTLVYKIDLGAGRPNWLGAFSFNPEYMVTLQNKLYAAKNGHLYLHNQTTNQNEFYGTRYSSKIMIVSNVVPNNPKLYNNVASESNLVPSFVYFYNDYPIQQASDLVDLDFKNLEGVFYATILRNKLVPTAAGFTTDGLLTGQKMRNTGMFIMWEWRIANIPLQLKFLNIGYELGRGQPVTPNG